MLMRLRPEHTDALKSLFSVIRNDTSAAKFHPHDFWEEDAQRFANYTGQDIYAGYFSEANDMIAYGMLRGIDDGFRIPSLGIYVIPDARGRGVSREVMNGLHFMARTELGASKVRLKVYSDNLPALNLYQKMGYQFETGEGDELVGVISLADDAFFKPG